MALARPMSYEIEIEVQGSSARAKRVDSKVRQTSQEELGQSKAKPRPKARLSPVLVLVVGLIWVCAVATCLLLVHRWATVAKEGSEITRTREELARLETENQALQAEAARLQSLASIEERALALGMMKPATVRQVVSDPTAVANKQPLPEPDAPVQVAGGSLWQSVRTTVGDLWQQGRNLTARLRIDLNKANASSP